MRFSILVNVQTLSRTFDPISRYSLSSIFLLAHEFKSLRRKFIKPSQAKLFTAYVRTQRLPLSFQTFPILLLFFFTNLLPSLRFLPLFPKRLHLLHPSFISSPGLARSRGSLDASRRMHRNGRGNFSSNDSRA